MRDDAPPMAIHFAALHADRCGELVDRLMAIEDGTENAAAALRQFARARQQMGAHRGPFF